MTLTHPDKGFYAIFGRAVALPYALNRMYRRDIQRDVRQETTKFLFNLMPQGKSRPYEDNIVMVVRFTPIRQGYRR